MYDDEELFDHQVTAWTVGQLRAALDGVPDDLPVTVVTAEEPGSGLAGPDQVVISAVPWARFDGSAEDVRAGSRKRRVAARPFRDRP